jgi:hypothetical protein
MLLRRSDFGAILFVLAALLGILVVVELALHAVGGAVEQIDRRPQEVGEVGFETRVRQRRNQRVEDVGDRAGDDVGFGQRPRVWLVLEWTVAIELQLGEEEVGRRCVRD